MRHPHHRPSRLLTGLALLALLTGVLPSSGAWAQSLRPEDAGFPFELPKIFSEDNTTVEINIPRFLLGMVTKITEEDEDFSRVIAGLQEIKVRIAEVDDGLPKSALDEIRDAAAKLDRLGWYPLARVRDEGDTFYIYLSQDGDSVDGVIVLFAEDTEAGLIYIRGTVDPDDIGRLGAKLDLPGLSEAIERHGPKNKVEEEP